MPTWAWILIAVGLIVVVALIAWSVARARRTAGLRSTFGPEYDRMRDETGDRRETESELQRRRERREELDLKPLAPDARARYSESWRLVQERFVDHPVQSVREADQLVGQVMADRGYPVEDFEERSALVSVDHPQIVENYRTAHGISSQSDRGQASTEDLRRAMIHFRALFVELLGDDLQGARRTG